MHTIWPRTIQFDPAKSSRNQRERGFGFERAAEFDFARALIAVDARKAYGEVRYVALGMLADRLHVLCFTEVPGGIRVISFRKANAREVARHAQIQAAD